MRHDCEKKNMNEEKGLKAEKAKGFRRKSCFIPALLSMTVLLTARLLSSAPLLADDISRSPISLQAGENKSNIYDTNIRRSLERQKDFGDPEKANRYLDRLFDRFKTEIKSSFEYTKEEALEALRIIGRILHDEENFEYSKNKLLIEELNKDRQSKKYLDCDDSSSIYLAAAEHIGLPLKPVYFPDHVFLKCELENDSSFFWEPTMAVESHTAFYSQWTGVSFEGGFPIILDQTQLEAIQLSDLGVAWFYREDYQKASEFFQKSVEANSEFGTAYNNLGASLAKQGKLGDALDCYQTAIDKNPLNATAFLNTGVAFYRLGDFQKSVKFFDKTLKINPGSGKANLYKYRVLVADGKPRKAVRFLNQLRR
jgi:tetratricopeptide (TPR) repeat protein